MSKKVGVVTGSSNGIGKAIAISFAKSGEYFAVIAKRSFILAFYALTALQKLVNVSGLHRRRKQMKW